MSLLEEILNLNRLFPQSRRFAFVCLFLIGDATITSKWAEADERLDFNRDVRPILANHCWSCHGPDEASRKANLRLDYRATALLPAESGEIAIVPNQPDASSLITRVQSADEDLMMPPPIAKKPLSQAQKSTLRRWITEGAEFAGHWAFTTPQRPALPGVRQTRWPHSAIDYFVLKRLEDLKLSHSLEADRAIWLRRVSFDLTGLPPSPEELGAFLEDSSPSAYEKVVDRLLASPRHAERMAMQWLDAARYADTNGYNNDEMRTMWPWRDWVIAAFAKGMAYDQFLVEQLAGDLLPNPTLSQRVATGFNRNHVLTTEGGIIEEEYQAEYVADRVHTTATVLLALSVQCARCHDHKYDPISQREFYQFAAYFNNVPDKVVSYSKGRMAEPLLKVPSPEQQSELDRLQRMRTDLEALLRQTDLDADRRVSAWEQSLTPDQIASAGPAGLIAHFPLDEIQGDHISDVVDSARRGVIRGKVSRSPGRFAGSLDLDGSTFVDAGEVGAFESDDKLSLTAWLRAKSSEASTVLSKIDEANAYRGYDVILEGGKVASHFSHHWPDQAFKVITKEPISLNEWHHVAVTYDGSRQASGVKIYVDGHPRSVDVTTNNTLSGTLHTDKSFHIGQRHSSAPFLGGLDEVQLFARELTSDDVIQLASGQTLATLKHILSTPASARTETHRSLLRQYYLDRVDEEYARLKGEQANVSKWIDDVEKAIPETMVMLESTPRRPTHVLRRGQYDQLGEEVSPGIPAVFGNLAGDRPTDRLALARWITSPSHPLTSRVAVNRLWETLFGAGLVETSEDFGIQGALPSHPELLDWLAREFLSRDWNHRELSRMMVLSATYRQEGNVTAELLERDPHNRLLARGPRYRLPAEMVRDNALAISGLLCERLGGPSVKPFQPAGLWEDVSVERREKYAVDTGDGAYRRSMYTFWKRTCPPPGMSTFDAPDRETCVIRRARTNTPLQALVLLNDPTYVEAARKLAERMLGSSERDIDRLAYGFTITVSRLPHMDELHVLTGILNSALERFRDDTESAEKLLSIGPSPRNPTCDTAQLAAWTVMANLLLNMDETISKP